MSIPDRQKQRREYLKKKAGMYTRGTLAGISSLLVLLYLFLLLRVTVNLFHSNGNHHLGHHITFLHIGWGVFVCGVITFLLGRMCVREVKKVSALPYIPPAITDTLPAEEVLVRGSQEPIQKQSAVLLRAAGEKDDKPEQLLRASVGEQETGR